MMRLVWGLRKSRDASQPVNLWSVNLSWHAECLRVVVYLWFFKRSSLLSLRYIIPVPWYICRSLFEHCWLPAKRRAARAHSCTNFIFAPARIRLTPIFFPHQKFSKRPSFCPKPPNLSLHRFPTMACYVREAPDCTRPTGTSPYPSCLASCIWVQMFSLSSLLCLASEKRLTK